MKKLLICTALVSASVALSGCGTLVNALGGASTANVVATVRQPVDQAFTLAYDALSFVEVGLIEPAVQDGAIKGINAQHIGALIRQTKGILDTAFNGYKSGQAGNPSAALASAYDLIKQIKVVLNGAGVATPSVGPAAYFIHPSVGDVRQNTARVLKELERASWRSTSTQS